jgi:hypothetical protein
MTMAPPASVARLLDASTSGTFGWSVIPRARSVVGEGGQPSLSFEKSSHRRMTPPFNDSIEWTIFVRSGVSMRDRTSAPNARS